MFNDTKFGTANLNTLLGTYFNAYDSAQQALAFSSAQYPNAAACQPSYPTFTANRATYVDGIVAGFNATYSAPWYPYSACPFGKPPITKNFGGYKGRPGSLNTPVLLANVPGGVRFGWSSPNPQNDPITGWLIHRRVGDTGTFDSFANLTGATVRDYTDTTAVGNVTYYYTVTAQNSVGTSFPSSPVRATVPCTGGQCSPSATTAGSTTDSTTTNSPSSTTSGGEHSVFVPVWTLIIALASAMAALC
eukprot:TRINITY_DN854_c0_g1_i1.p1 TRINITY_DN854_c0_g1~~TRINITY_DN854_c0_g1_i1.p1  ORF type:complete len:247 (-),score=55.83 TRINITY_DN854_c0_g1_i1:56-796(-)